jgi:hypothetical protein
MKTPRDVVIHRKAFFDLFNDFAWFTVASKEGRTPENRFAHNRFCTAAILYGGLCVEAAANCCLNAIGLTKEAEKELEFAKTLSKFDIFLIAVGAKNSLVREHRVVSAISELISTRNGFVHPKVSEIGYVYVGERLEKPKDAPPNKHNHLRISRDRDDWTAQDAHMVYVAVHDFLNFLFFNTLGLDHTDIDQRLIASKILNSEIEHFTLKHSYTKPGRHTVSSRNPESAVFELGQEYDLDTAFFGWHTSDGKNQLKLPSRNLGDSIIFK